MSFKMLNNVEDFDDRQQIGNWENKGKKGKLKYENENGITIPICPFCNEPAYEEKYCVFCGADFEPMSNEEKKELKKLNHEITVRYKNITIQQFCCSLYTFKNGVLVSHTSLSEPLTQEELEEIAKQESETQFY